MKRASALPSPNPEAAHPPWRKAWFNPALLAVALLLAGSTLSWLLRSEQMRQRSQRLAETARSAQQSLGLRLRGNEAYLQLLAAERTRGTLSPESFQEQVGQYVAAHRELINVTWVDSDFVIRGVAPETGNRQILGLSLTLPEPRRVAHLAADHGLPAYTRPFEAIQGRPSFEVWVPVFRNGALIGLFAGVYSCDRLLREALPATFAEAFNVELRDSTGSHLGGWSHLGTPETGVEQQVPLEPPGQGVMLRMQDPSQKAGGGWVLLLEMICVALVLGMGYGMWVLKDEAAHLQGTEEALRRSEAFLARVIEQSPHALWIADAQGTLVRTNQALRDLLCATDEELVGIYNVLEDPLLAEEGFTPLIRKVFEEGQAARFSMRYDTARLPSLALARRTCLHLDITLSPILDAKGKVTHGIIQLLDMTARLAADAERRELLAQLHQSQKLESLGSLAGGVAHDINNVLAAILSLASAHEEDPLTPPAVSRALATIAQACLRGREVVKGLLYFARKDLEAAGPVDLNALAEEMVHLLANTTLQRVHLQTRLQATPPVIEGDAGALSHALMNLCVNAVDAMEGGGTLEIGTSTQDPDTTVLSVRDTGHGMDPEVLKRAMDPFFTTKPVGKGTGLGLSMVYGTMTAHKGTVEIHSQPGQGTEVRLLFPTFPRGQVPVPPAALAGPAAPAKASRALRILLVDDDDLIRSSLPPLLEALGHQVQTAEGGLAALERLEAGLEIDLIILDMNMPDLNGAQTLPRILALRPGQRVLLASGYSDEDIAPLVRERPKVSWISKPFTLDEIRERLSQAALDQ